MRAVLVALVASVLAIWGERAIAAIIENQGHQEGRHLTESESIRSNSGSRFEGRRGLQVQAGGLGPVGWCQQGVLVPCWRHSAGRLAGARRVERLHLLGRPAVGCWDECTLHSLGQGNLNQFAGLPSLPSLPSPPPTPAVQVGGERHAVSSGQPVDPASVQGYLQRSFGAKLEATKVRWR